MDPILAKKHVFMPPWTALGRLLDFIENWTSFSEQMWPIYHACAQNLASRSSPPDPADLPDPAETESGRAEQTLGSSRRGAG